MGTAAADTTVTASGQPKGSSTIRASTKLKERELVPASLTVRAVRKVLAKRLARLVALQLRRRRTVQAAHFQCRQVGAVERRAGVL
jgi:erythromycin esterase-like protein